MQKIFCTVREQTFCHCCLVNNPCVTQIQSSSAPADNRFSQADTSIADGVEYVIDDHRCTAPPFQPGLVHNSCGGSMLFELHDFQTLLFG